MYVITKLAYTPIFSSIFQNDGGKFVPILVKSFREEGVSFLFKGWTPAFIRLAPNTVLLFVFYEVSTDPSSFVMRLSCFALPATEIYMENDILDRGLIDPLAWLDDPEHI